MSEYFNNNLDHFFAELKCLELKLKTETLKMRKLSDSEKDDRFRGLYISDEEIDSILNEKTLQCGEPDKAETPYLDKLYDLIKNMEATISARKAESLNQGIRLRLVELEKSFELTRFDIDILLTGLLPEMNLKFQKLFGYLQDDITRKKPSIDLLLRILSLSEENKPGVRRFFGSESPLIKYHLISLEEEQGFSSPLLAKFVRVDERILNYLLEIDDIDSRISRYSHLCNSKVTLKNIVLPDETREHLEKIAMHGKNISPVCYFQGVPGSGKKTTAEAICRELEKPLLIVYLDLLVKAYPNFDALIPLIFREGMLQNSALFLDNCDILFSEDKNLESQYQQIVNELEFFPSWCFFSFEKTPPGIIPARKPVFNIDFPVPTTEMRIELWNKNKEIMGKLSPEIDFVELSSRFKLNAGQIKSAAASAFNNALWRDPENLTVFPNDLYLACRQQSNSKLNSLAKKITPKYNWRDIVLPDDQMEQLKDICNYVKHYQTVYTLWGFEKKLSLGKGLNALFAGPSGTGKTMAAEIIAKQLGIDLYKINLSAIVSKYIGETEKNLENIFKEGQTANAILFFDEADALFGKRSEVRDSHDRYANIEIAYLLQRMEEYDGIVILATNMKKNMDEAFVRRLHNNIEFPMPEEEDRLRIWKQVFPVESPLSEDIDFQFLARQFKISGGNIKNIALGAAFLAAADTGEITMNNLIIATKREFQKMGKLCTEGDFAVYFDQVKT